VPLCIPALCPRPLPAQGEEAFGDHADNLTGVVVFISNPTTSQVEGKAAAAEKAALRRAEIEAAQQAAREAEERAAAERAAAEEADEAVAEKAAAEKGMQRRLTCFLRCLQT